ncbi:MAG: anti-sigma factor [Aphanocapsa sp. GSE-SYN-MK-11-07L]|jgi:anti-sigma-K factor RskA|nr:anti-sigma factor [Aphanocapsa sp. GSE-SYN-MK-11-07L]
MSNSPSIDEPMDLVEALTAGYVLDDLSPEEAAQFEQLLRQQPELNSNVAFLQEALATVPYDLPQVAPPPRLRHQILQAIQTPEPQPVPASQPPEVIALAGHQRRITWGWLAGGIAALVAIAAGLDNLRLRESLQMAERGNAEKTESLAQILQHPNSKLVSLKGSDSGTGTLLFTPGKWQEVVLSLQDLPPLPPAEVYRLWLTLSDGAVLPCGEFTTDLQGKVFIRLNPPQTPPKGNKAKGMFVTKAPVGSPLEPTGTKILSGTI